jgi:peptidoglycan/LPS O-acetylase OafA/YrhL
MTQESAAPAGSSSPSPGEAKVREVAHPRLTYRPDLDGLRAIAILLVIVDHAGLPTLASAAGVTAFFVLSGYLITSILLVERQATGRISLRGFYQRRLRRLGPAFAVMLAIVGVLGLVGVWGEHWRPDRFIASVFYVTNWPVLFGTGAYGVTDHAWSLAIEEQFYLSWPLLVAFAPRRLVPIAIVGIGIALVFRHASSSEVGYYATFARMDGLLLGAVLAIAGIRLPRWVGLGGLALLAIAALSDRRIADLTTLATVAAAMIVVSSTPIGWLAPLGKRAYSLYLWSTPSTVLLGPAGAILTFVAAELSYRFVERPFLRHGQPAADDAHRDVERPRREGLGAGEVEVRRAI